ncbi:MAG: hypothetical protein HZB39_01680 [Planctomycetes bacterium]|nr:hypothetical protein [Planctomycetota bacterium]
MTDFTPPQLAAAVAAVAGSGVRARFVRIETVVLLDDGAIAWDGEVHVFELTGHPRARSAYAWTGDEGRPVAILGELGVATASDAVARRRNPPST